METVFLIFVVLINSNGYESLKVGSDMTFKNKSECLEEVKHYDGGEDIKFFCSESYLFPKK